jgi:hypothetical protein
MKLLIDNFALNDTVVETSSSNASSLFGMSVFNSGKLKVLLINKNNDVENVLINVKNANFSTCSAFIVDVSTELGPPREEVCSAVNGNVTLQVFSTAVLLFT